MKKILNDPFKYVDEMLAGLCAAHPEHYAPAGEGEIFNNFEHLHEMNDILMMPFFITVTTNNAAKARSQQSGGQ